jgi:hypothetical protein
MPAFSDLTGQTFGPIDRPRGSQRVALLMASAAIPGQAAVPVKHCHRCCGASNLTQSSIGQRKTSIKFDNCGGGAKSPPEQQVAYQQPRFCILGASDD